MANEIWTIKRCLEWTKEYLAERGEEHPRLSAEWLLCAATGLARIDLYMRMDETLDAAQLETMHAAVVRRAKGEPRSTSPVARSFAWSMLRAPRRAHPAPRDRDARRRSPQLPGCRGAEPRGRRPPARGAALER